MGTYPFLQTLVWDVCDRAAILNHQGYWVLPFPAWYRVYEAYEQRPDRPRSSAKSRSQNRSDRRDTLPTRSLHNALRVCFGDLLWIRPDAHKPPRSPNQPWLYARSPIPADQILRVIRAWILGTWGTNSGDLAQQVYQAMQADLAWQPVTANDAQMDDFLAIPHAIAARLCGVWTETGSITGYRLGNHTCRFRPCAGAGWEQSVELIAWPPIAWEHRGTQDAASVVVKLQLETFPDRPDSFIHVYFSLRRWLSRPWQLGGDNSSVYFLAQPPWSPETNQPTAIRQASLTWRTTRSASTQTGSSTQSQSDKTYEIVWADQLLEIVQRLNTQAQDLPEPNDLCQQPERWLDDPHTPLAVPFHHRLWRGSHSWGEGVPLVDRLELFDQLTERLGDAVRQRPPYHIVSGSKLFQKLLPQPPSTKPLSIAKQQDKLKTMRTFLRDRLMALEAWPLTIEFWYQCPESVERLQQMIAMYFGDLDLSETALTDADWAAANCTGVHLDLHEIGDWTAALNGQRSERDRTLERIHQIATSDRFPPRDRLTLALVEINDHNAYKSPRGDCDPKAAIRTAFAQRDRLTQFLVPRSELDEAPAKSRKATEDTALIATAHALFDGLRQLGVSHLLTLKPTKAKDHPQIPADLTYVALWCPDHKLQKQLGIWALRLNPSQLLPEVLLPNQADWVPYPEACRLLGTWEGHTQVNTTVETLLQRLIADQGDRPTLLLCEAQNVRRLWPQMQNQVLQTRELLNQDAAEVAGDSCAAAQAAGWRIARVRTDHTPQWWSNTCEVATRAEFDDWRRVQGGLGGSLFAVGDRLFFSSTPKPNTSSGLGLQISKFRPWISGKSQATNVGELPKTQPAQPNQRFPLPHLLEVALPVLQPGDDPARWATLVHELRDLAWYWGDRLVLPLPLHLVKQLQEYIPPTLTRKGHR